MRTWAKGSARAALLTASFVALGAGVANADVTSGHHSILGGNQANPTINLPVNVCGNAASVLGHARAHCEGGAEAGTGHDGYGSSGDETSGNHSILGGNQVNPLVNVPVNVCGNGVGVLGHARAHCKGGAEAGTGHDGYGSSGDETSGNHSILGGNQVNPLVNVPVNVCGNGVGVLGHAKAHCKGGAEAGTGHDGYGSSGDETSGNHSILGGNQVNPLVNVPVNVCGNAIGGDAKASCEGGAKAGSGGSSNETSGNHSIGGGNQVNPLVNVPVNICGNSVSVLGSASAACGSVTFAAASTVSDDTSSQMSTAAADDPTSGNGSLLGGNEVSPIIGTPINGECNSVALLGSANGSCGGGVVSPPQDGGNPPGEPTPPEPIPPVHHAPTPGHEAPAPAPAPAAMHPAAGAELPFTGMNLGSLLALAFGAIAAGGACLVAASRRRIGLHRG